MGSSVKTVRELRGFRGDLVLAGELIAAATLEIRTTASRARHYPDRIPPENALARIHSLADMCLRLRLQRPHRPSRRQRGSVAGSTFLLKRANWERPMTEAWYFSGPDTRTWILEFLDRNGFDWEPPPPVPEPVHNFGVPLLTIRDHFRALTGWPVQAPDGKAEVLPGFAVLKAVDTDTVCALFADEVSRGRHFDVAWLRANLDPNATNFLVPDPPSDAHWPKPDSPLWHCRLLLRMVDGELLTVSLTVIPETFIALPSTLTRMRQRRLVLGMRRLPRHLELWRRDREAES